MEDLIKYYCKIISLQDKWEKPDNFLKLNTEVKRNFLWLYWLIRNISLIIVQPY